VQVGRGWSGRVREVGQGRRRARHPSSGEPSSIAGASGLPPSGAGAGASAPATCTYADHGMDHVMDFVF
jgi:hypothetical protein